VLVLAAPAAAHTRVRGYQDMAELLPRDWESPYELVDGVPMVDYGTFKARNPVTTAQYGLANWSIWIRYHDRSRARTAVRVARWLLDDQRADGTWGYQFENRIPGTDLVLPAGWPSALAQGQAISLLRRAYAYTREMRYLRGARKALRALDTPVRDGGLVRWYRSQIWFEEYPSPVSRVLVLNGMMQTVLGLYDLADRSELARRLYRRGLKAIAALVPLYDGNASGTYYSLVGRFGYAPLLAPPDYHAAHARLLRQLDGLSPHARFRKWAKRWEGV
jgi:hypothetical protein